MQTAMVSKKNQIFILLFYFLLTISCKKEEKKEAINSSLNYEGGITAYINNNFFSSCAYQQGFPAFQANATFHESDSQLNLMAIDFCADGQYISLEINNFNGLGSYILSNENFARLTIANTILNTDSNHIGKIIITNIDTVNRTLAGNFYFKAIAVDTNIKAIVESGSIKNVSY